MDADIPYLLLTPGPLSTSPGVRAAMQVDLSTWDREYNDIVQGVRARLVALAGGTLETHTAVLMQGSGTFSVEAAIGSLLPADGKLLVLANGAYGDRMAAITRRLGIAHTVLEHDETAPLDPARVARALDEDAALTHVGCIHCETTTGMLNPLPEIARVVADAGRVLLVDAMSSFGGMPLDLPALGVPLLVSSANKCIQGVPGFGFVVVERELLSAAAGRARSVSLDLHAQWRGMEEGAGKWRFTSPTHTLLAFARALEELEEEGGVAARHARYSENQRILRDGYRALGFRTLLPDERQSPIITSFHDPRDPRYDFGAFYEELKRRRFVIYPGKVSRADTFRVGTIGHVFPDDVRSLVEATGAALATLGLRA